MTAEKLSITLPSDMVAAVRALVEGGSYASNSEVIRDALRLWMQREEARLARLNEIRAKIIEAENSTTWHTVEEVDEYFKNLHERLTRKD